MTLGLTRREILGYGVAGATGMGVTVHTRDSPASRPQQVCDQMIAIESTGGGVAAYEFTVSDTIQQTESSQEDSVSDNRAYGWVGPDRGLDRFRYSGGLTGFRVAGPARVLQNGQSISPSSLPPMSTAFVSDDFDTRAGENAIRITSNGGGVAVYQFAVTESLQPTADSWEDTVSETTAYGWVGPDRGVDTFTFTGEVARFTLVGPATVELNGEPVTGSGPDTGDEDGSVEFIDCNTIRVTGEFETLLLKMWTFAPGIVDYHGGAGPVSGTTTISVPDPTEDVGVNGAYIGHVDAFKPGTDEYTPGYGDISKANPNGRACVRQIRPDRVRLGIETIERTGRNTYAVTFWYDNPNTEDIFLTGTFTAGQTPAAPPDAFTPGQQQFTVHWRPANDTERLIWEVPMPGYDQPTIVRTPPANKVGDDEPSALTMPEMHARIDALAPTTAEVTEPTESVREVHLTGANGAATVRLGTERSVTYIEDGREYPVEVTQQELATTHAAPAGGVQTTPGTVRGDAMAASNPTVQSVSQQGNETYVVTIETGSAGFHRQTSLLELILIGLGVVRCTLSNLPEDAARTEVIMVVLGCLALELGGNQVFSEAATTTETATPAGNGSTSEATRGVEGGSTPTEKPTTPTTTTETPTTTTETPTTTTPPPEAAGEEETTIAGRLLGWALRG